MIDNALYNSDDVVEITLDAGPDADEYTRSPEHINYEYVQRTVKGITRSFVLFDDVYFNYSLKTCNPEAFKLKFFRNKDIGQQHVNITYLDPKPGRLVHIAWNWFVNGLAAIAWAFVIIYVGEYTKFSFAHDTMLPVGILLGTFGVIAFMIFYYKTQDKVIYRSYIGQVPVLELFHMPRNKAYNDFIDVFEESIYKAHHSKAITMKYRLIGELQHLRKMKEAGLIVETDYEKARSKIFRHEEYQA